MKKNKFFVWGMLAVTLTFGLVLGGCDTGNGGGGGGDTGPTLEEQMNAEDFGASVVPTMLTISTKAQFEAAKTAIEGTAGNYVLTITGTVDVGGESITLREANTIVSLRGGGTLYQSGVARLFIPAEPGSKLILRDAVLKGNNNNSYALVFMADSVEFVMYGGTITGNTSSGSGDGEGMGGGVLVANDATFTMKGGTISGNTSDLGGGVAVIRGTFTMSSGTISGNTADDAGGVYVEEGAFTKTGGTIYGKDGSGNQNEATNGDTKGHAVYVADGGSGLYRDTTAGPGVNLDSGDAANWGE